MRILTGANQLLRPLAFSPDGRWLASGAEYQTKGNREVQVWDLTGGPEPAWSGLPNPPERLLVFEPDGRHLLVANYGHVRRVDLRTGQMADDSFLKAFRPTAFSADGRSAVGYPARNGRRVVYRLARWGPGGWANGLGVDVQYRPRSDQFGFAGPFIDPTGTRGVHVRRIRALQANLSEIDLQSFDGGTGRPLGKWSGTLPTPFPGLRWRVGLVGVLVLLRDRALFAVELDRPKSEPVKRQNTSPKHLPMRRSRRTGGGWRRPATTPS